MGRGHTRQCARQCCLENARRQRPRRSRRRALRSSHLALRSRFPKHDDITTHCARRPSGGVDGRGRVNPLRDGGIARPDASGQEPLMERGSRHLSSAAGANTGSVEVSTTPRRERWAPSSRTSRTSPVSSPTITDAAPIASPVICIRPSPLVRLRLHSRYAFRICVLWPYASAGVRHFPSFSRCSPRRRNHIIDLN